MRSHRTILRKIAEENLDPSVVHVAGKNGSLHPKKEPEVNPQEDVKLTPKTEDQISVEEAPVSDPPMVEKKKTFPPKKKKVEAVTPE